MSDTVTLPMTPETFWGLVGLTAALLMMIAVFGLLSGVKPEADDTALTRTRARFGMAGLPEGIFALGLLLWGVIFCALFIGLLWTIISAAFHAPASTEEAQTALRFVLISLTAQTATLGAVVAFPFTLIRIALTRKQTETAEEALFNDKINAAAAGLAARRQVTRIHRSRNDDETILTEWEDDLVTRASAIDRLEGLANERPDTAARVARMLSIYVRELSRQYPAKEPPEGESPQEMREWAAQLTPIRSDMEKAAQSLGRLQAIEGNNVAPGDIDLRDANLQLTDLKDSNFDDALLNRASLDGAYLGFSSLRRARLGSISGIKVDMNSTILERADLTLSRLICADLFSSNLRGANLFLADMRGANLSLVDLDLKTELDAARLLGAGLYSASQETVNMLTPFWGEIFVGGGADFSCSAKRPLHWQFEMSDWGDFLELWYAWQETLPDFNESLWRD